MRNNISIVFLASAFVQTKRGARGASRPWNHQEGEIGYA